MRPAARSRRLAAVAATAFSLLLAAIVPAADAPAEGSLLSRLGATRPTAANRTPEQTAAADAREFDELLARGLSALHVGEWQAALESFQDARSVFRRRRAAPAATPLKNPPALPHGLAIAYMKLGAYDRAKPLIEEAYRLDPRDRAILVNRAAADATQRVTAMRAVKDLTDYFTAHPDELDEPALNILGAALTVAIFDNRGGSTFVSRQLLENGQKLYDAATADLENRNPGQRRWGGQWFPSKAVLDNRAEQQRAITKWETTRGYAADAQRSLQAAQRAVDSAQGGTPANHAALRGAKGDSAAAEAAVKEAWAAIPREPWPKALDPVLPAGTVQVATAKPNPLDIPAPRAVGTNTPTGTGTGTGTVVPVAPPPEAVEAAVAAPARRVVTRYAAAFPIAPDLLLTAAAPVGDANRVVVQPPDGDPVEATVERRDAAANLALLRLPGQRLPYLNLAAAFAGGDVQCAGFPTVSLFDPVADLIPGRAVPPRASWAVMLTKHPRLAGAPLMDAQGGIVGVVLADRDAEPGRLPSATLADVRTFLGKNLPATPCANPNRRGVYQVTVVIVK